MKRIFGVDVSGKGRNLSNIYPVALPNSYANSCNSSSSQVEHNSPQKLNASNVICNVFVAEFTRWPAQRSSKIIKLLRYFNRLACGYITKLQLPKIDRTLRRFDIHSIHSMQLIILYNFSDNHFWLFFGAVTGYEYRWPTRLASYDFSGHERQPH